MLQVGKDQTPITAQMKIPGLGVEKMNIVSRSVNTVRGVYVLEVMRQLFSLVESRMFIYLADSFWFAPQCTSARTCVLA